MNAQDPLAQLKDIQLPEPVSCWPPAPGWWILAIIFMGLIAFSIWKFLQYKHQQQYRKTAAHLLAQAKTLFSKNNDVKAYLQTLAEILRRTALTAYSEQSIESLQGDAWLQFLDTKIQKKLAGKENLSFTKGPAKKITSLPYQDLTKKHIETNEIMAIHDTILFWVNHHANEKTNKQTISKLHYA